MQFTETEYYNKEFVNDLSLRIINGEATVSDVMTELDCEETEAILFMDKVLRVPLESLYAEA